MLIIKLNYKNVPIKKYPFVKTLVWCISKEMVDNISKEILSTIHKPFIVLLTRFILPLPLLGLVISQATTLPIFIPYLINLFAILSGNE